MKKKIISLVMALLVLFSVISTAFAQEEKSDIINEVGNYILKTVHSPAVGSIGGEWAIIGLARSNVKVDEEYYENYYRCVEDYTRECKGVLHNKKYTEYSRVILALSAIGKNPENVAGYNLLLPLGDFEKTIWQGINGPIWALIALDSKNYEIPVNPDAKTQSTREMYVQYILESQKEDGGWSLSKNFASSDIDITAMALTALSKYLHIDGVKKAVDKALLLLEKSQNESGGFSGVGASNCESSAQVLAALCALGIRYDSPRFVKSGKTVLDDIMSYYSKNAFKHLSIGEVDPMATEQAFYSLVALWRFQNKMESLYTMTDAIMIKDSEREEKPQENLVGKTFSDIINHKNQDAIEKLAAMGIINGKSETLFDPDSTMTRAEFATIIVKALKLDTKSTSPFEDVKEEDWFYSYVIAAYENKIVNGVSDSLFNPYGTITRQEAAVMLQRSARILGVNTEMELMWARDILAGFIDYVKTASWAVKELAFCIDKGIIDSDTIEIMPTNAVNRGEIAQMIFNLLQGV